MDSSPSASKHSSSEGSPNIPLYSTSSTLKLEESILPSTSEPLHKDTKMDPSVEPELLDAEDFNNFQCENLLEKVTIIIIYNGIFL